MEPEIELSSENVEIRVYPRRWIMLFLFSMASLCNSILYSTFAPISFQMSEEYSVSIVLINTLSTLSYIMYIPLCFVASWMINEYGLRFTTIFGSTLGVVGGWIRVLSSYWISSAGFSGIFIGQSLAAAGGVFIVGATPAISSTWFGPNERIQAMSLAFAANTFGIALGFLISPAIVTEGKDIPTLLLLNAIICTVFGIAIFFLEEKPPHPPSLSQQTQQGTTLTVTESLRMLVKNLQFNLLSAGFALAFGGYFALSALVQQLAAQGGYSTEESGVFGFSMLCSSIAGQLVSGVLDKYQKHYKLFLCASYCATSLCFVLFSILISQPNLYGLLVVISIFMGASAGICSQVTLAVSMETTYPVPEGISANVEILALQISGVVLITIMSLMENVESHDMHGAEWLVTAPTCFITGLMFFFKGKYRRMEADQGEQLLPLNAE